MMPMRYSMVEALRSLTSRPNRMLVVSLLAGAGTTWASAREAGGRKPWSVATVVDAQAPPGNKAPADLGTQRLDTIDDLHWLLV